MTLLDTDYFVIDDLIGQEELLWIYHKLIETRMWFLTSSSVPTSRALSPFVGLPGMVIENEGVTSESFLAGYFRGLAFRVGHDLKKRHKFALPADVVRILVGAQNSYSKTKPHVDSDRDSCWSVLAFLNPVWEPLDGGHFLLDGIKIEYKPGRIIVFRSTIKHEGGFVQNNSLPYWRVVVNIILGPQEAKSRRFSGD